MSKRRVDFFWVIFILFVFFLPISSFISTRILVFLFVLILTLGERKFNIRELLNSSWDILLYLSVICTGLLYSSDHVLGLRTLETSFALLALPFICYRLPTFDKDRVNKIFLYFSLGIIVAGFICTVASLIHYFNYRNTQVFFFYDFTDVINSHPTYLAYYLIFSITFGLYVLSYERLRFPSWIFIITILFYFIILLLTGGQTAFVGLLFVFAFFLLKFFLGQSKALNQRLAFGLTVGMLITMVFISSFNSAQREQALNDSWDRFELWRSGILANSDFLLGVGTGDYKNVLNEYYRDTNQGTFADGGLNSHNQFIQIFFSNGMLGLLAVMFLLLRPLYLSFKDNDQLGILLLFPFLIYGMTEVFLGRYQGVAFFALLHQVLITHYLNINKAIAAK